MCKRSHHTILATWSIPNSSHEIQFTRKLIFGLNLRLINCEIKIRTPTSVILMTKRMCVLQYGLYGSFLGCFLYIFFGSCKDVPFGPTAIISLLTYQTVAHLEDPQQHAILLCFMAGVIELLMGIFGLGKLFNLLLILQRLVPSLISGVCRNQIYSPFLKNRLIELLGLSNYFMNFNYLRAETFT